MMLENTLKHNEAVALKDEDLEQVTGGASVTVGTSTDMAQGNIDMAQGNIDFCIFERSRATI